MAFISPFTIGMFICTIDLAIRVEASWNRYEDYDH